MIRGFCVFLSLCLISVNFVLRFLVLEDFGWEGTQSRKSRWTSFGRHFLHALPIYTPYKTTTCSRTDSSDLEIAVICPSNECPRTFPFLKVTDYVCPYCEDEYLCKYDVTDEGKQMYRLQMASFWAEIGFQALLVVWHLTNFKYLWWGNDYEDDDFLDRFSLSVLCGIIFLPWTIEHTLEHWNSRELTRKDMLENICHLLTVELTGVVADVLLIQSGDSQPSLTFIRLSLTCLKVLSSIWVQISAFRQSTSVISLPPVSI